MSKRKILFLLWPLTHTYGNGTIPAGSIPSRQAARVIHSDIEREFIRAEVIKYQDLIQLGNEQKVREAGKPLQKGRDYVVEDGDIINFLFNV